MGGVLHASYAESYITWRLPNHSVTMGRLDAYYHKKKREQELWECLWRSDEPEFVVF